MLATRLYARAGLIDLFRRLILRISIARDAADLVAYYERLVMMLSEDRLRNGRILLNEDAASGRNSIMEEAYDYARTLRLLCRR